MDATFNSTCPASDMSPLFPTEVEGAQEIGFWESLNDLILFASTVAFIGNIALLRLEKGSPPPPARPHEDPPEYVPDRNDPFDMAMEGDLERLRELLDGVDLTAPPRGEEGPPLGSRLLRSLLGPMGGDEQIIDFLLEAGAESDQRVGEDTPLHIMLEMKNMAALEKALPYVKDVNVKGERGETPLMSLFIPSPSGASVLEMLPLLLANEGIRLTDLDEDGDTALHHVLACYSGGPWSVDSKQAEFLEVIRTLKFACPDLLKIANRDGKTPLDMAKEFKCSDEVVGVLTAGGFTKAAGQRAPVGDGAGSGAGADDA